MKRQGYDCATCGGFRLHQVVVHKHRSGKTTHRRVCTACCTGTDLTSAEVPGACPKCGHIYTRTTCTRGRLKPRKVQVADGLFQVVPIPVEVRWKRCEHRRCRHRYRTLELAEALFR